MAAKRLGSTALHIAAANNQADVIKLLTQRGCELTKE